MKNRMIRIAAAAALAAGLTFAQAGTGTTAQGQNQGQWRGHRKGAGMFQSLNLTDDQKAQAKQIFGDARTASQPVRQQLRDARQQLAADAKSNAPENVIAKDSQAVGALVAQMTTIRTKAMQQFYGTLTAEQKAKLDELKAQRGQRANRRSRG